MRLTVALVASFLVLSCEFGGAQESTPGKQSLFARILHPFGSSEKIPEYRDPKLRGLALAIDLPSQPVKLSEMRQLPVVVTLTNRGRKTVELAFPTEQRIEILLRDSGGKVVNRWSDNRAFENRGSTVLINPGEHLEYSESIATRDLEPDKVFTIEALVPPYPELDVRRKAMAVP